MHSVVLIAGNMPLGCLQGYIPGLKLQVSREPGASWDNMLNGMNEQWQRAADCHIQQDPATAVSCGWAAGMQVAGACVA